jgi:regulator of RNase E activity RraA
MNDKLWQSNTELFDLIHRELFTCVVGDVMDRLGFRRQFLPPEIRPLDRNMVVIGRAMTVLEADFFAESVQDSANPLMAKPFGLMFRALDDLKQHEVYICTGASPRYALWGELMSLRAIRLGAGGAVLDGFSRDTKEILALKFPTFSYGSYGQDQGPRGKVVDFRVPIEIGGVSIRDGDIVFGDVDGVCIIPREIENDVLRLALEKVRGEQTVRDAIEKGISSSEAFDRYQLM